jgi:PAS domain-containing protein
MGSDRGTARDGILIPPMRRPWVRYHVGCGIPETTCERLLNGIFEILPVGVWIADQTGTIVRTNPAGLRIWAGARYVGVSGFGEYKTWLQDRPPLGAAAPGRAGEVRDVFMDDNRPEHLEESLRVGPSSDASLRT